MTLGIEKNSLLKLSTFKIEVGGHSSNLLPSAYNPLYPFVGLVAARVFAGDGIHADAVDLAVPVPVVVDDDVYERDVVE